MGFLEFMFVKKLGDSQQHAITQKSWFASPSEVSSLGLYRLYKLISQYPTREFSLFTLESYKILSFSLVKLLFNH